VAFRGGGKMLGRAQVMTSGRTDLNSTAPLLSAACMEKNSISAMLTIVARAAGLVIQI
jgi:hypothetical protein